MNWSRYFIPTLKEIPKGAEALSHQLLLRGGLIHMLTSGVYTYLPLGLRVINRIEKIIREEMNAAGAQELFLPCLQPLELWQKTGRDKDMGDVLIRFIDKHGRHLCLGPTHEEVITDLVKGFIQSYKQMPLVLYQLQTKFRDEPRTRFGIVRACEFIMKDAYSFDADSQGLERNYQLMYEAYRNIFHRCGLDVVIVEAEPGAMGGDVSHEFMVPAPIGEDTIVVCSSCSYRGGIFKEWKEGVTCPQCHRGRLEKQIAIELGHIFQLGSKYSQSQEAFFLDEKGEQRPILMGCYGIGVSRLMAAIVEGHNDTHGIIWPPEVAPFDVEILIVHPEESGQSEVARQYAEALHQRGWEVLVDDRSESPGRRFFDADLIGIPWRVTVGKKCQTEGRVEIKNRRSGETVEVEKDFLLEKLQVLQSERLVSGSFYD